MIISRFLSVLAPLMFATLAPAAAPTTEPTSRPTAEKQSVVQKISLADFEKMQSQPDTVVLDVRTPREFAEGHVPGAVNIDWHSRGFSEQVEKLDKSKNYLVHCMGGVRSAAATRKMNTLDFEHLYDFSGGWLEYEKSGKPVEK